MLLGPAIEDCPSPFQLLSEELSMASGEMVELGAVFDRCRRWISGADEAAGADCMGKYSARLRSCKDVAGEICGVENVYETNRVSAANLNDE